ncbi:hypothetical protein BSR28_08540 [Boudabousia liubingyangii]|uniref:hypothetical protein n=1 Tax=Boudabousia liubingyangii TaxID=1921764 RepID=UPI00093EAADB|nr:hypothetical protein [Boudabousia liubingyangii]OKL46096.1 hypothetical protein BSR28_08540 [Boudabousia liubingyangii]
MLGKLKDQSRRLVKKAGKVTSVATLDASDEEVLNIVDRALNLPAGIIKKRIEKLRERYPQENDAQLIDRLNDRFVKQVQTTAGTAGVAAVWPGLGTAASLAVSTAQFATFVSQAAWYVLSVAEIRGLHPDTQNGKRTLLLTALIGEDGPEVVAKALGGSGLLWAQATLATMSGTQSSSLNRFLAKYITKRAAKTTGKHMIKRALPLGIGAVLGWRGGAKLAEQIIAGTRGGIDMLNQRQAALSKAKENAN